MDSIMAGLCCGEPCTIGWEILRDYADNFVSVPDSIAAKGMRVLGNPLDGDVRIISGESGACTTGFVVEVMQNESLKQIREQIGLNGESRILCISTEGDTLRRIQKTGQQRRILRRPHALYETETWESRPHSGRNLFGRPFRGSMRGCLLCPGEYTVSMAMRYGPDWVPSVNPRRCPCEHFSETQAWNSLCC